MTKAQKTALNTAREAVRALQAEPPAFVSGSIRDVGGGFYIRLCTEVGDFVVRTSPDGTVETISEEKGH